MTDNIRHNIEARELADELAELCYAYAKQYGSRFWESLRDRLPSEFWLCVKVSEDGPGRMTDEESLEFGKRRMPFGDHKHERVDDVPIGYLEWLADQPDFRKDLIRYLRSERVQRE